MTFRSEFIKNILKSEPSKPSKMVFESFESPSFSENDKNNTENHQYMKSVIQAWRRDLKLTIFLSPQLTIFLFSLPNSKSVLSLPIKETNSASISSLDLGGA